MRLVVTGAKGFIGSYFQKKYSNIYKIQTFSFLKDSFEDLCLNNVDVVVHLSALVHQMSGAHEQAYENINVTQTLALALKAKESGVSQFVFMSTVKVYGEKSKEVYAEYSVCNPEDVYGKSKLKAEKELQKLENETFKVSILRTPIVYGYSVKANMQNLMKLIDKVSILPFGKIENQRSFAYVGNLCALIDCVIRRKQSGIFLASDDEILSTTKLIELIAKAKNRKICLLHVQLFEQILRWLKPSLYQRLFGNLVVDNTQTKAILEFKNPYSVEEGIRLMVQGEHE